ncbi:hypothetical protein [Coprobacillus sp. AF33-1AC]|uniref:hypothetical protein n=1 Tax=Coprobacillus sp. AF33-1AC TaxID=2292032 RepID=UPI000E4C9BC1|nr:hypothetical protein [Coprobacillus sp. AF33-1AC]RHM59635.1 hypothetical protein DWZ53_08810 [Coprobacillus sp. AF33-1AC]
MEILYQVALMSITHDGDATPTQYAIFDNHEDALKCANGLLEEKESYSSDYNAIYIRKIIGDKISYLESWHI